MITIPAERYKELVKTEAKLELLISMAHKDRYFDIDDFMALFEEDKKKEKDE